MNIIKNITLVLCILLANYLFYIQLRWYTAPFDFLEVDLYLVGCGLFTVFINRHAFRGIQKNLQSS